MSSDNQVIKLGFGVKVPSSFKETEENGTMLSTVWEGIMLKKKPQDYCYLLFVMTRDTKKLCPHLDHDF